MELARRTEVAEKLGRVRELLRREQLDALLLSRRDNFAWLSAGGDSRVAASSELGEADLVVEPGSVTVLANNIEAPRLAAEELAGLDWAVETYPWHRRRFEAALSRLSGLRAAADTAVEGLANIHSRIAALRVPLTPPERAAYRRLGQDAAAAVEETLLERVRPGASELEVAGLVAGALWETGSEPTVVLVAADERVSRFRHPLPTGLRWRTRLMVVVCARRRGLIVAFTRLLCAGAVPAALRSRHDAVCRVDAALLAATRPGRELAAVWRELVDAYAREGFPEEWQLHHQGGGIGYENREFLLVPGMEGKVEAGRAYAWNPSITGTKSEDTLLVAEGPELVTVTERWPLLEVEAGGRPWRRPDLLVL